MHRTFKSVILAAILIASSGMGASALPGSLVVHDYKSSRPTKISTPAPVRSDTHTVVMHERIGQSNWHVIGCKPNKDLTLYYNDPHHGIQVARVVQPGDEVSYSIAKDLGYTNADDLNSLADSVTLTWMAGCEGIFEIH